MPGTVAAEHSSRAPCAGAQCLSDAGQRTPTLRQGPSISLGPVTCGSSTSGGQCTWADRDWFLVSSVAATPLGHATALSGPPICARCVLARGGGAGESSQQVAAFMFP